MKALVLMILKDKLQMMQTLKIMLIIRRYNYGKEPEMVVVTQKFARFVSKIFNMLDYSDDEIFKFIDRFNDVIRKQRT